MTSSEGDITLYPNLVSFTLNFPGKKQKHFMRFTIFAVSMRHLILKPGCNYLTDTAPAAVKNRLNFGIRATNAFPGECLETFSTDVCVSCFTRLSWH